MKKNYLYVIFGGRVEEDEEYNVTYIDYPSEPRYYKNKEKANDYDDYIDEFEITLITRREDGNDKFIQREYCRESSCPSWLRNCVK